MAQNDIIEKVCFYLLNLKIILNGWENIERKLLKKEILCKICQNKFTNLIWCLRFVVQVNWIFLMISMPKGVKYLEAKWTSAGGTRLRLQVFFSSVIINNDFMFNGSIYTKLLS